jgi:hypothetical protein
MFTLNRPAVIIAGTRTFGSGVPDKRAVAYLDDIIADAGVQIATVISGGARGADSYGEQWAAERGIPVERFPIRDEDWERHGGKAAYYRNLAMAYASDTLIALWDGQSKGTCMMIELAEERLGPDAVYVDEYR